MENCPNVLFVTLDSVRHDHTSVHGYERDTTPSLRRIADRPDGATFDSCIAHGKHTPKSSASILTGTYPSVHRFGYEDNVLDPDIETIAERFSEAGYRTVCVSNNAFVSEETGFGRGFDDIVVVPKEPLDIIQTAGPVTTAKFLANIRRHSAGLSTDIHRHSGVYLTTAMVKQRLRQCEHADEPFFFYVHYNEPHRAYHPPLAWLDTFSDAYEMSPSEAGDFAMEVHHNLSEMVAQGCPFSDDEWAALKALYDAEIKYTDTFVGELFEMVEDRFAETITVVTADHGENFGERGALAHRFLLDEAIVHVPLVTHGFPADGTDQLVQHTDVMRTILDHVGADSDGVQGINLETESREFAISQDSKVWLEGLVDLNPEFDTRKFLDIDGMCLPDRSVLRTPEFALIEGVDGTSELYSLPDEATDVSDRYPDQYRELQEKLQTWLATEGQPTGTQRDRSEISDDLKQRLSDMGYLEDEL